jgi:hypothetical protein
MSETDVRAELRWFTEHPQKPPRLQEAYRSDRGRLEWRDVPLTVAPPPPKEGG